MGQGAARHRPGPRSISHAARFPSLPLPGYNSRMNPIRIVTAAFCCALILAIGCNKKDAGIRIAYVTNGVDPFWNTAAAGVKAAAKEFNVDAEVHMPAKGIVDQKRIVEG